MNEELKKEAEEWLCNNLHSASEEDFIKAMVDFAEPREKQIQIDAEQIRALQKQNGELTDKVKELEAEIEKFQKINNEQKETLKKVRVALIQERTANIMNYGKGGVEMFDDCFEILKGVSN